MNFANSGHRLILFAIGLALLAPLALAGCGSSGGSPSPLATATAAPTAAPTSTPTVAPTSAPNETITLQLLPAY